MSKLVTLEMKLGLPEGSKFSQSVGSVFHGLLMEYLDRDYGDFLHQQNLKPFSQCVYYDRGRQGLYWRISVLNAQAEQEILQPALALPNFVHLKQKNVDVCILDRKILRSTDYGSLAEKYFAHDLNALSVEYSYLTSCSFKTDGSYAIFPQPHLVLGSLVKKWNAFADKETLEEQDLLRHLCAEVYVYGYNLKLQPYAVEKVSLPAFRGTYTLSFKHNIMVAKIISMLAEFAGYSGTGIKTALGMGATEFRLLTGGRGK